MVSSRNDNAPLSLEQLFAAAKRSVNTPPEDGSPQEKDGPQTFTRELLVPEEHTAPDTSAAAPEGPSGAGEEGGAVPLFGSTEAHPGTPEASQPFSPALATRPAAEALAEKNGQSKGALSVPAPVLEPPADSMLSQAKIGFSSRVLQEVSAPVEAKPSGPQFVSLDATTVLADAVPSAAVSGAAVSEARAATTSGTAVSTATAPAASAAAPDVAAAAAPDVAAAAPAAADQERRQREALIAQRAELERRIAAELEKRQESDSRRASVAAKDDPAPPAQTAAAETPSEQVKHDTAQPAKATSLADAAKTLIRKMQESRAGVPTIQFGEAQQQNTTASVPTGADATSDSGVSPDKALSSEDSAVPGSGEASAAGTTPGGSAASASSEALGSTVASAAGSAPSGSTVPGGSEASAAGTAPGGSTVPGGSAASAYQPTAVMPILEPSSGKADKGSSPQQAALVPSGAFFTQRDPFSMGLEEKMHKLQEDRSRRIARKVRFAVLAVALAVIVGGSILAFSLFATPSPDEGAPGAQGNAAPQQDTSRDLSETGVYRYNLTDTDGNPYSVTETVEYGKDGLCSVSTTEAIFSTDEMASQYLTAVKSDYGVSFLSGETKGTEAVVKLDIASTKYDRKQYETALRNSVQDFQSA